MRKRAFTLVELLIVISLILVLLATALPSLGLARRYARTTVCRSNLRQMGTAFTVSRNLRPLGVYDRGHPTLIYPNDARWPGIPSDAISDPGIYICPEAGVIEATCTLAEGRSLEFLNCMEFVPPNGTRVNLSLMNSDWHISRLGQDERGSYREYLIEDDYGDVRRLDWHGWLDSDGLFRIYDSGVLWILDHIPQTAEFAGAWAPGKGVSTCGDNNRIFLNGENILGGNGKLSGNRGLEIRLPVNTGSEGGRKVVTGASSYGINIHAHKYPFGYRRIVLLDYSALRVDPDQGAATLQELFRVGRERHFGSVNVLFGDGSVRGVHPMEIDPQGGSDLWGKASDPSP